MLPKCSRFMRKYLQRFYCYFLLLFLFSTGSFAQKCDCTSVEALQNPANIICKAKSNESSGISYLTEKKFDTAELYFQKAEKLYKESGCSDSILLTTYKYWAQLYYTKGNFGKSQEYCFKLLRSAEVSGNPYEVGTCYTMIAQLFNQTGQPEKGILYSRLAVAQLAGLVSPVESTDLLFKLSKRYLWHYQDTRTIASLDSSELFSYQQLAIARKINKKRSIATAFNNLQGIAWEKNDLPKALQFLDSAFAYTDTSEHGTLAVNYFDKADILTELKNFDKAEQMADSAMYYYRQSQSIAYIAETYELLSRIALEKKDYRKAYESYRFATAITDSIKNVEKTKEVTELERKYSQANNEKTIRGLAQQKRIYLLLALAGLLGLAVLAFLIRQQSLTSKQKILETEQRLNRARMNPHFFFNALGSLQSFALAGNDGKVVAGSLAKFSHIMRETLESTYKEYVSIGQETIFLTEYLELQKLRFPQKFNYEIITSDNMETDEPVIPSMILQPFVENSIEHGFSGIGYPGHLIITFDMLTKELQITITDNGKGLAIPAKENNEHISRASQIIRDRIFLLNKKLKTKAGFSINSNTAGKGVTVKIVLPLLYKDSLKP
jgi:tetratricopeptide (TPR) repeat protein